MRRRPNKGLRGRGEMCHDLDSANTRRSVQATVRYLSARHEGVATREQYCAVETLNRMVPGR